MVRYAAFSIVCLLFLAALTVPARGADRVTVDELKSMLEKKEPVVLIDVRTPGEHREAHIPGSILMPLSTLGGVTKLPGGGRVILYCRSGSRSRRAYKILSAKGFKGLSDLKGGILAWVASGGEVVSGLEK
jgi:rhodanese-related sulfurtransferase